MKLTKVVAVVLIVGFLATFSAFPQVAEAGGRYYGGSHYHGSSSNYFWGGLAVGAVTGLVVGSILAAPPVVYQAPPPVVYQPPPVVYQPPPVVYQPAPVVYQPAPVCSSYWVNTYWNGYQWVPGYWAQACR
jgi:hypothetical protein